MFSLNFAQVALEDQEWSSSLSGLLFISKLAQTANHLAASRQVQTVRQSRE